MTDTLVELQPAKSNIPTGFQADASKYTDVYLAGTSTVVRIDLVRSVCVRGELCAETPLNNHPFTLALAFASRLTFPSSLSVSLKDRPRETPLSVPRLVANYEFRSARKPRPTFRILPKRIRPYAWFRTLQITEPTAPNPIFNPYVQR